MGENATMLGENYMDDITGFTGMATARAEYLTRGPSICLEAKGLSTDGKTISEWFDESRLRSA